MIRAQAALELAQRILEKDATPEMVQIAASMIVNGVKADERDQEHAGPHGCHVDLEPGQAPDGCVLDDHRPQDCVYARALLRDGKTKLDCEYWKPIQLQQEQEGV